MTTTRLLLAITLAPSLVGCGDDTPDQPDQLVLPNDSYPESLSSDADGTLYVGSITAGTIAAYDDGATTPRMVLADASVTGVAGVLVHGDALWICSVDAQFRHPTEVKSFGLDGAARGTYPLGAMQFCNDMTFDAAGNLYSTDSFSGTVMRLPAGGSALETWFTDPALAPASQGAFGLDGIVAATGALYLGKLDTGGLYRVPINADGSAGAATSITVTPALVAPDGIRALDDRTLLVAQNSGTLAKVAITGDTATATALATDLDQPTGVTSARGSAWVSEGQLGRLFAQPAQPPIEPFLVRRVDL
jgi:hypothetical protein